MRGMGQEAAYQPELYLTATQVLLKPIVSQLVAELPASLEEYTSIPSIKEVDDLLVVCVGQMAVTASNELLWKPLNHELYLNKLKQNPGNQKEVSSHSLQGLEEQLWVCSEFGSEKMSPTMEVEMAVGLVRLEVELGVEFFPTMEVELGAERVK
ncbi:Uncharacterized protein LOK49_LG12G02783 [Camellia lanceoleosa]|uniref:Uncharacterized protein n=1 Tax=Camellia lanceoleosa TaxID=1840588 RepID=A0ACC0FV32_9ERIC|nr:Uncharacterized protein LOK49_LG12G02783 [Camellia lanceoleosa]